MSSENRLQAIDVHSHWSTRRGYPLQTEAELTQQERTWRSKPAYRTEAEMAEDFRDAGVRVILDFGYTKYLPIEEANRIHDYGFATQQAYPDVIIGRNRRHFSRHDLRGYRATRLCGQRNRSREIFPSSSAGPE
jgi:hypothetical protein